MASRFFKSPYPATWLHVSKPIHPLNPGTRTNLTPCCIASATRAHAWGAPGSASKRPLVAQRSVHDADAPTTTADAPLWTALASTTQAPKDE